MIISLLVALDEQDGIGQDNRLPWHLSADLLRFKAITMGKQIHMGRKTHESIGRPLPGRTNIILTRDTDYDAPGCIVTHTLEQAVAQAEPAEELMVIGGAELYRLCLPLAQRLYLTHINAAIEGDTFFPTWEREDWNEVAREDVNDDASVPFTYSFLILDSAKHPDV